MENKQINNPTRSELITDFVKSNPEYYIKEFQKIGSKPSFSFSFNFRRCFVIISSLSPAELVELEGLAEIKSDF